jgi:hypothetical protein
MIFNTSIYYHTFGDLSSPQTLKFSLSSSWPQVAHADVVEEGGSALGRLWVMGLKEDGHGGASGGDCFLSVHPGIFGYFVPEEPLYAGCPRVLTTAEVKPQSENHRGSTSDVLAPGRDSVAMSRGDGNGTVDTRRGGSEIKGQLLGTLPTMNITRVLVPVDTIDQRPLASAPVLYYSLPGGGSCSRP